MRAYTIWLAQQWRCWVETPSGAFVELYTYADSRQQAEAVLIRWGYGLIQKDQR